MKKIKIKNCSDKGKYCKIIMDINLLRKQKFNILKTIDLERKYMTPKRS